ncbi:MAG: hypothetical protein RSD99_11385, partial [Janthinobacterium sp.]
TLAAQTLFYQLSLMDEYRVRVERALERMATHAVDDTDSEMRLHGLQAHLLLHTQGITGTMLRSFQRAYALAMRTDDGNRRFEAICGMWLCSLKLADFQRADSYVTELAVLCEARDDTAMRLVLARMRAVGEYVQGRYAQSAALARMVLAHPEGAGRLGCNNALLADQQVCLRGTLARCLWMQGRPDDALALARETVAVGFEHNGVTLCVALAVNAIPVALWCGQRGLAHAWTCLLCEHAGRYGLLYWSAWGAAYQRLLDGGEALADFPWPSVRSWPIQVDLMATLHDAAADSQALRRARMGLAPWSAPEVLRRDAHHRWRALAQDDAVGLEAVRAQLDEALLLARDQQAPGWELRCATSLAAVLQAQGCRAAAHAVLAPVHAGYRQGRDTMDVMAAAALLAQLA